MSTNHFIKFGKAFLAALVAILFSSGAFAQTLSLMTPTLANVAGAMTACFGIAVEDQIMLKEELEDGAELALKCGIRLYRDYDYWFDKRVSSASFESVLSFDALTKEFTMTLPVREALLRNTNLSLLLHDGWANIETNLGSWDMLERGERYSFRLNATMNQDGAPEGISRFIYFWSWDAGAKSSFQLDFKY